MHVHVWLCHTSLLFLLMSKGGERLFIFFLCYRTQLAIIKKGEIVERGSLLNSMKMILMMSKVIQTLCIIVLSLVLNLSFA